MDQAPQDVGKYKILEQLGEGGMGVVYKALDPTLDRLVALKLLPEGATTSVEARERFLREARVTSALDHPNVATIHEIGGSAADGPDSGPLYIAMAYYEGETVREKIRKGALSISEAIDVTRQIAAGLAAAHRKGIVHRDIKPANVVVTPEGVAKIVDFGIAMLLETAGLTGTGTLLGTVGYMSPEQASGGSVDARTDIWSLGVVLYEALAGERPFRGNTQAVLYGIRNDLPEALDERRADLPAGLAEIVTRCLQKNPSARFQTADAVEAALSAIQGGARSRSGHGAVRGLRRSPGRAVASAAAVVVVMVATVTWLRTSRVASDGSTQLAERTLAVFPFVPVVNDTALARLGRELVVTLSANLDGVGGLRTVDALTILARVDEQQRLDPQGASALARDLGVSRFIHGTLIQTGSDTRLDVNIYRTDGAEGIGQATVTGRADEITAFTDSVTLAILDQVADEDFAAPNLAAITTASVPALRAYLRGEEAFARGQFQEAVDAFDAAFGADPSFWFAYWRSLYPRVFVREARLDSAALAGVFEHRAEFPPQDRRLVEAARASTTSEQVDLLEGIVADYPYYWPAWYSYANVLVHFAPYVGTSWGDARRALERVVELNPGYFVAWDHLMWILLRQRDLPGAERALASLLELQGGSGDRSFQRQLATIRMRMARGDFAHPDSLRDLVAWSLSLSRPMVEESMTGPLSDVHVALQLRFGRAVLEQSRTPEVVLEARYGMALAWAARGAWDSALVQADLGVGEAESVKASLRAYGLAVSGVILGAVGPDEAERLRPADPGGSGWTERDAAELAWLEGLLSFARGEPEGIRRAAAILERSPARYAQVLRRSLSAFGATATGDQRRGAAELVALEREIAEAKRAVGLFRLHPYVTHVHRFQAARWLRALGDEAEAARLLTWSDAIPAYEGTRMLAIQTSLSALSLLDRAEIAEARGQPDQARIYYGRFLELHDLPDPELQPLVERARTAFERLGFPVEQSS